MTHKFSLCPLKDVVGWLHLLSWSLKWMEGLHPNLVGCWEASPTAEKGWERKGARLTENQEKKQLAGAREEILRRLTAGKVMREVAASYPSQYRIKQKLAGHPAHSCASPTPCWADAAGMPGSGSPSRFSSAPCTRARRQLFILQQ